MSFKIEISGIEGVQKRIADYGKTVGKKIQPMLDKFGQNTVNDAKRLSPINEGFLRNSITFVSTDLSVEVVVAADYAAFIEFGTKKFAAAYVSKLPTDWQVFAASFKGAGGGSFEEMVMRITQWVKKKKVGATYNTTTRRRDKIGKQTIKQTEEADAYAIALYILRNGIQAHPFLFPAVEKNRIELIKDLKKL